MSRKRAKKLSDDLAKNTLYGIGVSDDEIDLVVYVKGKTTQMFLSSSMAKHLADELIRHAQLLKKDTGFHPF